MRFLCPTPESLSTLRELFICAIKTTKKFTNGRPICLTIYNGWILATNPVVPKSNYYSTIIYCHADWPAVCKFFNGFNSRNEQLSKRR